jgi:hypothetical protein
MGSLFHQPESLRRLRPDSDFRAVLDRRQALFAEGSSDHLSNCFRYEMQTYLVDLLVRQDKMTMAHSVENRVPFLDRKLVDFTRSISARHLVGTKLALRDPRMRATKVLLKRLAAKLFNDRFAYRAKSGFSLPIAGLFGSPRAARLMEDQILPGIRDRGLINSEVVRGQWKRMTQLDQAAPNRSGSAWRSSSGRRSFSMRARPAGARGAAHRRPSRGAGPRRRRPSDRDDQRAPAKSPRRVLLGGEVTGYMASCWQKLAEQPGIDLHVLHTRNCFSA